MIRHPRTAAAKRRDRSSRRKSVVIAAASGTPESWISGSQLRALRGNACRVGDCRLVAHAGDRHYRHRFESEAYARRPDLVAGGCDGDAGNNRRKETLTGLCANRHAQAVIHPPKSSGRSGLGHSTHTASSVRQAVPSAVGQPPEGEPAPVSRRLPNGPLPRALVVRSRCDRLLGTTVEVCASEGYGAAPWRRSFAAREYRARPRASCSRMGRVASDRA
jgi:hypothetical protein